MQSAQLDLFLIEVELMDLSERKKFELYYFTDGSEQQREAIFNKLSEDLKNEMNGQRFSIRYIVNKKFPVSRE